MFVNKTWFPFEVLKGFRFIVFLFFLHRNAHKNVLRKESMVTCIHMRRHTHHTPTYAHTYVNAPHTYEYDSTHVHAHAHPHTCGHLRNQMHTREHTFTPLCMYVHTILTHVTAYMRPKCKKIQAQIIHIVEFVPAYLRENVHNCTHTATI